MTRPARATVLAVGSELLGLGRVDTNSHTIADALAAIGIEVRATSVVGDDRDELQAALVHALTRCELVFLTGGLGPTDDDVTREVVAAHLGRALTEDQGLVEGMRRRFAQRGRPMPEVNRRQAMVPEGAVVLENPHGTAPGLWFLLGRQGVALLPGPPREMRPMLRALLDTHVAPGWGGAAVSRRQLVVAGQTESGVEARTQPLYRPWADEPLPISTTILASPGVIELHLAATGPSAAVAARLDAAVDQLAAVLGPDLVSRDGRSLEETTGAQLVEKGWRAGVAESCTGGLTTSRLTDVPGSSAWLDRSVVCYSNDAKQAWLGVSSTLLEAHGAVSGPVAAAMASGLRQRASVDVAVAITGIAGPAGGSEEKPVGTVWLAIDGPEGAHAMRCWFPGGRRQVKTFASSAAIDLLRRYASGAELQTDWVRR